MKNGSYESYGNYGTYGETLKNGTEKILALRRFGITVLPMQTITFKVSDAEASLIRALAKQERASLSEYLRRRATGMGKESGLPVQERCEFTDAMIFSALPSRQELTTAAVRAMLTDFP